MNKGIAIYLRLSRDDDDKDDESNSISSQRSIIKNYLSSSHEFYQLPILEFTDDGYSGTNFERPGIKRLLDAVRKGEVSCVIVKDFSRFGRSYLAVSKYIEVIFPCLNIRFISVNDRYDSNSHKGTTADIDVAFRNLMNAMYSKDISKKVKTAKLTKIRQGKNINAFTSYGYKKSKADKHRLEIDEPAAEVVRKIFTMFCEGRTPTQIAKTLSSKGVPTPSEYKKLNGSNLNMLTTSGPLWSSGIVNNILHNEQYLGTLVCGKAEVKELGSKKSVCKPRNDWIRIPGAHPPIIDQEIWDKVYMLKSRADHGNYKKPDTKRFLYKKIRCGYCGHIMRYRSETKKNGNGKYTYYYCETPRFTDEFGCSGITYIPSKVEDAVILAVKSQIALLLDMEKVCREEESNIAKSIESTKESIKQMDSEMERMEVSKQQIYECYKRAEIDIDEYLKLREELEAKISAKKSDRNALLSKSENMNQEANKVHQFYSSFVDYKTDCDLQTELVNALIENVYVFGIDRIEVKLKFADEMALMEKQLMCITEWRK